MISILLALALAQSQIDLKTQAKNPNFGGFAHTTPQGVGTSLPGTCAAGETFFLANAAPGQQLYTCSSANVWTQIVGSGATSISALTDFRMGVSGNILTIGANCSVPTPCNIRYGSQTIPVQVTATATNTAGVGTAYVYLDTAGTITVASTGLTNTCTGCSLFTGSSIPADTIPIGTWTVSAPGAGWDTNGGQNFLAAFATYIFNGGLGFVCTKAPNSTSCVVDTSIVPLQVSVPGTATTACVQGQFALSTTFRYDCVATNTWRRVAVASW